MGELSILQQKVQEFVTEKKLHLKGSVSINKTEIEKGKVNAVLVKAKNHIVESAALFMTSKERVKRYLNEIPSLVDSDITTITFDAYVFSEQELMDFVDMVEATPKFKILN